MDEENIVRRMINGDMDAFGELMEKYERPALRAAWLVSGNAADSEDIVQETFTACYLNRKKLRDPAAFKTWFYRILTRSAWKISRKSRKEQPEEEPASGQADTRKVRPGKLHYEGRGADPLRGGGKAAVEAEDRVDPVLLQ